VKSSIIGVWAILIVVVFFYVLQAYPNTSGIDFISTALGALLGSWLIGALLFGLAAGIYKVMSGNKLQGFKVVVPLIATGMVVTTLIVLY